MTVINKQEEVVYDKLTDDISLVIFVESCKEIEANKLVDETTPISHDEATVVGNVVGQRVLAKAIDITKDMTREQLVGLLAHSTAWYSTFLMNEQPLYFTKIVMMAHAEEEKEAFDKEAK